MRRYDDVAATPPKVLPSQRIYTEKRTPVFDPNPKSNVLTPAMQATLITFTSVGALICGIMAVVTLAVTWLIIGLFLLVFCPVFIWRLGKIDESQQSVEINETVNTLEPMLIDQLPPQFQPDPVLLNPYQGQAALEAETRTTTRQQFESFIWGCEQDTSMGAWESSIGRDKYRRWRNLLMAAGWAHWKGSDKRQGWELTTDAQRVIDAMEEAEL